MNGRTYMNHSVRIPQVSTLVQKILVDHVIGRVIGTDPTWGYAECLLACEMDILE